MGGADTFRFNECGYEIGDHQAGDALKVNPRDHLRWIYILILLFENS